MDTIVFWGVVAVVVAVLAHALYGRWTDYQQLREVRKLDEEIHQHPDRFEIDVSCADDVTREDSEDWQPLKEGLASKGIDLADMSAFENLKFGGFCVRRKGNPNDEIALWPKR